MLPALDPILRPLIFAVLTVLFVALEALRPKRRRTSARGVRWFGNVGVLAIGTLFARLILPVAPIGAAIWAQQNHSGLFNLIMIPGIIEGLLAFLALDFLIYAQHRIFHYVPILWRIHRIHHTDLDIDVTTGLRFHPIEILLSSAIKIIAVIALGADPGTVIVFEIVLNGTSLFNHANLALPSRLDWLLRLMVVTPDMHRVHHSVRTDETNSNFGFNLPWWDRALGTYRAQPLDGHIGMTIGLPIFRSPRALTLGHLLIQPFVQDSESTPRHKQEKSNDTI
jgi:sterol desaturase/sphingolipid hydroxylase (fatty acid hydroxylase superfamily)